MAGRGTLELLLFHRLERDFFHRLVRDLGQDPESMRWVMALWLWLESSGHHDFIRRVSALPGTVVLRFVDEALACLGRLAGKQHSGAGRDGHLPCTNALLAEPIDDVGYFDVHREEIMDGVAPLYKNVCRVVFDDDVAAVDDAAFLPSNVRAALLGGARAGPPVVAAAASSPRRTAPSTPPAVLNPMASPWFPVQQQIPLPDDYRSLFMTFSRGYPISKEDITEFFNSVYGPCVETVMIERAPPGQLPVYGRIVLRSPAMIPVVLDGQQTAKFVIKGRQLWARIYVPSSVKIVYA